MNRHIRRELVGVLLILASSTSIADAQKLMTTLPPAFFDRPYLGTLTIWIADKKTVREHCYNMSPNWSGLACAKGLKDKSRCIIYIVKDEVLTAAGYHPSVAMRHELGHCNGWSGDHSDGVRIRASEPVRPWELPQTTVTVTAYTPTLCIKPDGTDESCANRQSPETKATVAETAPALGIWAPGFSPRNPPPPWPTPWNSPQPRRTR